MTWLNTPPVIDGDLSDWNLVNGASSTSTARAPASHSAGMINLCLAYKINEPNPPMRNRGVDWRNLFISGDCVDLMLQTVPKAETHRRTAVPQAMKDCS